VRLREQLLRVTPRPFEAAVQMVGGDQSRSGTTARPDTVSSQTPSTRPVRCTTCAQPLESPICCTSCGALNPYPPDKLEYFELFGLTPAYDLDEQTLHRKYLSLTRNVHPDMVGQASPEERQHALAISSEMNRAYETLRDPVARAEYLLSLSGDADVTDSRSVPPQLLGEIMTLREEIEEAHAAGDSAAMDRLRRQVGEHQRDCMGRIAVLGRAVKDDQPETRKNLREQINAIKYWNNLMEKLLPGDDAM
jgi:molecular chaperone HscB